MWFSNKLSKLNKYNESEKEQCDDVKRILEEIDNALGRLNVAKQNVIDQKGVIHT